MALRASGFFVVIRTWAPSCCVFSMVSDLGFQPFHRFDTGRCGGMGTFLAATTPTFRKGDTNICALTTRVQLHWIALLIVAYMNPVDTPTPRSASGALKDREEIYPEMNRRNLLAHLFRIGASSLATAMGGTALMALAAEQSQAAKESHHVANGTTPTKRKFRYGMVIDTRRCVGCKACVVACKAENKTPPGVSYTVVLDAVLGNQPDEKPLFMTKPCFHCENPPCVDVCPVGATFKRESDGIVVVDYDRCIGCRYCITGCPYGARYFDYGENYAAVAEHTPYAGVRSPEYNQFRARKKGVSPEGNVRKCTFCVHLQDSEGRYDRKAGRWPACAKTCTGHAIHFGDFNDPGSEVSRLLRYDLSAGRQLLPAAHVITEKTYMPSRHIALALTRFSVHLLLKPLHGELVFDRSM